MKTELSEYEIQKAKHKLELVRNDLTLTGKYNIPFIETQNIDVSEINFLSFVGCKKEDKENADKTIHYFTHEWLFKKAYDKAAITYEKL